MSHAEQGLVFYAMFQFGKAITDAGTDLVCQSHNGMEAGSLKQGML